MKGQARWQSTEYRDWIRRQPCIRKHGVRGRRSSHAHHYKSRKYLDGSDASLICLCNDCHIGDLHRGGQSQADFFKSIGINPDREIKRLHEKFLREHDIAWDQEKYTTFEALLSAHKLATPYGQSKKVNRMPFSKHFIPLEERPELWQ
jgi:hypothetical protein